jgi:hypothetical protein
MLKHIYFETIDDELNFFNVESFDYNESMNCFVLLSQNNDLHYIPRETIKRIIL